MVRMCVGGGLRAKFPPRLLQGFDPDRALTYQVKESIMRHMLLARSKCCENISKRASNVQLVRVL